MTWILPSTILAPVWVGVLAAAGLTGLAYWYMGAAAVDERGVYASADVERLVKLELMDIADRIVLLIDHTKFSARAPVFLCDWGKLSAVVTDRQPPAAIAERLQADGIEFVLPGDSPSAGTGRRGVS